METRKYGYARVSSKEQNLDRQIEALHAYGVQEREIIEDKASGKDFEREGYIMLKSGLLRKGDTLVIKELDRLGRDYEAIKSEWHELVEMGVDIEVIDTPILNTSNKSDLERNLITSIVFEITAYVAEKERLKIRSRQKEGIACARANGKQIGRPKAQFPDNWAEVYAEWMSKEITAVRAMELLKLKPNTFYKFARERAELT